VPRRDELDRPQRLILDALGLQPVGRRPAGRLLVRAVDEGVERALRDGRLDLVGLGVVGHQRVVAHLDGRVRVALAHLGHRRVEIVDVRDVEGLLERLLGTAGQVVEDRDAPHLDDVDLGARLVVEHPAEQHEEHQREHHREEQRHLVAQEALDDRHGDRPEGVHRGPCEERSAASIFVGWFMLCTPGR
jgi:hypothetical protein